MHIAFKADSDLHWCLAQVSVQEARTAAEPADMQAAIKAAADTYGDLTTPQVGLFLTTATKCRGL